MEQHYWAVAALAIFHACLLIVAIISFIAGVDLWRLRMRGRKLAVTTMILIFPVTVLYLAAAPAQHLAQRFVASICLFLFGILALLYLFLLRVKRSFTPSTSPTSSQKHFCCVKRRNTRTFAIAGSFPPFRNATGNFRRRTGKTGSS
jgi:low temperature requirement protein LtrA